jgi:hypothetical protein
VTTTIEKLAYRTGRYAIQSERLVDNARKKRRVENCGRQVEALGHIVVHVSPPLQCNAVAWISLYPSDVAYFRTTILTTAVVAMYKTTSMLVLASPHLLTS